jgi:DNA-binding MarR family transcriptional regulator
MNEPNPKVNGPQIWNDEGERRALLALLGIFELLKEIDSEMPVQQMQVLLYVMLNEGKLQRNLCTALEMATSTASRNVAALSNVNRHGKVGADLIGWKERPEDRRSKSLVLTPKGQSLARKLLLRL